MSLSLYSVAAIRHIIILVGNTSWMGFWELDNEEKACLNIQGVPSLFSVVGLLSCMGILTTIRHSANHVHAHRGPRASDVSNHQHGERIKECSDTSLHCSCLVVVVRPSDCTSVDLPQSHSVLSLLWIFFSPFPGFFRRRN